MRRHRGHMPPRLGIEVEFRYLPTSIRARYDFSPSRDFRLDASYR
jgi:hypothetical protein